MSFLNRLELVIEFLERGEITPNQLQYLTDMLSRFEFFKKYAQEGETKIISEVARNLQVSRFKKHEPIFFKGDKSTRFYVVVSGEVMIMMPTSEGQKAWVPWPEFEKLHLGDPHFYDQKSGDFLLQVVSLQTSGMIFGELGLLNEKPRLATAVAKTDVTVIWLGLATFQAILKPSLMYKTEEKNKFLREFFGNSCTFDELWRLSAFFEILEVEKGKKIFSEGDTPKHMYIVCAGSVELSKKLDLHKNSIDYQPQKSKLSMLSSPLIVYGKRQLIGVTEFIEGSDVAGFTSRALEDTMMYAIQLDNLRKCMAEYPSFKRFFGDKIEKQAKKLNVR